MWIRSQNNNVLLNPKHVKAFQVSADPWNPKQYKLLADEYIMGTFESLEIAQEKLNNLMQMGLRESDDIYQIQ